MRAERADLRDVAFLLATEEGPPIRTWTEATETELRFVPDGFRIRASAPGASLLLLPVQYTSCWSLQAGDSPHPPVWIGRANALLTLVAFEHRLDATYRLDFGLGADAKCRVRDGDEMRAWL